MTEYTVRLIIQGEDRGASAAIKNVNTGLGNMSSVMGGILGADVIRRIATGFLDLGRQGFAAVGATEGLQRSIQALIARELVQTGAARDVASAQGLAAEKARELVAWNERLTDLSPFSQSEVSGAFNLALAYGFTSDQARRLTEATLDWAAGMNKSGVDTQVVIRALGQMRQTGKLTGQDIMQLTQAGVGVWEILSNAFGRSTEELKKMQQDGLLPADVAIEAIAQSLEEDFGGAAEGAQTTIMGLTSTLQDTFGRRLRDVFTPIVDALKPEIKEITDLLASPEFIESAREAGIAIAEFTKDAIAGIKELAAWWGELNQPTKDFLVFMAGAAVIGPTVISTISGIATAAAGIPAVLGAIRAGWAAWNAGMSLTVALGAAGIAPIAITVGAIGVAVAAVAAVWYTWNTQIDRTVKQGKESVNNAWSDFFNKQVTSGASAADVLENYRAQQVEVQKVIDETNPVLRLFLGNTEELTGNTGALAEALAVTAETYTEYRAIMAQAGLETMTLDQAAFDATRQQAMLASETGSATEALASESAALAATTPEMINAKMEADALAESQRQAAEAAANSAKAYSDLAMSLKDATMADIAKASIDGLKQSLDDGLIGPEQYKAAVENIGLAYGLMDEKSIALATNIPLVTGAFASGLLPAQNMAGALQDLAADAEDGNVNFEGLMEKWGKIPGELNITTQSFEANAKNIEKASKTAAENSAGAFEAEDWRGLGMDIAAGIADGINAGTPSIVEAASDAAGAAVDAAQDTLDIESPSKVMKEKVGYQIPAGMAEGIQENASMPVDAMAAVSRATVDATGVQTTRPDGYAPTTSPPSYGGVAFYAPVTFEVKNAQTLNGLMQELQGVA